MRTEEEEAGYVIIADILVCTISSKTSLSRDDKLRKIPENHI